MDHGNGGRRGKWASRLGAVGLALAGGCALSGVAEASPAARVGLGRHPSLGGVPIPPPMLEMGPHVTFRTELIPTPPVQGHSHRFPPPFPEVGDDWPPGLMSRIWSAPPIAHTADDVPGQVHPIDHGIRGPGEFTYQISGRPGLTCEFSGPAARGPSNRCRRRTAGCRNDGCVDGYACVMGNCLQACSSSTRYLCSSPGHICHVNTLFDTGYCALPDAAAAPSSAPPVPPPSPPSAPTGVAPTSTPPELLEGAAISNRLRPATGRPLIRTKGRSSGGAGE